MKKVQCLLVICAVMLVRGNCFAGDPTTERALRLASVLQVPTNSQVQVSKSAVFAEGKILKAGDFTLNMKRVVQTTPFLVTGVDFLDASNRVVATGRIIDAASFEMARKALLERIVSNSMVIEDVIFGLELRTNEIGDFCILPKSLDRTKAGDGNITSIHFVRGAYAVSLWAMKGNDNDIRPVAKAVDAMICEGSGTDKPASRK